MERGRQLIRRVAAVAAVLGIGAAATGYASPARTAAASRLQVVKCRTEFGISGAKATFPASVSVHAAPSATAGLVAYSNSVDFLIGPAHMSCAGAVGADGSTSVTVWPHGHRQPRARWRGEGLSLQVIPACVGCMAAAACPFFKAYAAKLLAPCKAGTPARETVTRPSRNVARFTDPAGVSGDGYPSGGPDPADGITGIKGKGGQAYTATCALPSRDHAICGVTLDDVLARYG